MLKTNIPNPEFFEENKQAYSLVKSSQILVICEEGFRVMHKGLHKLCHTKFHLQPSVTKAHQNKR